MTREAVLQLTTVIANIYTRVSSQVSNEIVVAAIACPVCHARADEGCTGQYTTRSRSSLHADRRVAARQVLKSKEWRAFRDELKARIIERELQEYGICRLLEKL